jgi:prepilin-type N-terminal cleavage/methylation domain-containing protein
MRHPSRSNGFTKAGFTLIELMIVLTIVALIAGMAVAELMRGEPRTRLVRDAAEIQQVLLKARSQSIRDFRMVKLCFFRDTTPADVTPIGHYTEMECNDINGTAGCAAAAQACNDTNTSPYFGSSVETAPCPLAAGKWCVLDDVDLTSFTHSADHVSINGYYDGARGVFAQGATGQKKLELTYQPDGTVNGGAYTTTGLGSGYLTLTNFDQCFPSITTCTSFSNTLWLQWTVGGVPALKEF